MANLKILTVAGALSLPLLLSLPLALAGSPASAATAHNSQAGSWGPNSHQCEATPYFRTGACLSSFIEENGVGGLGSPRRVLRDGTDPYYRTLPPPVGY